MKYLLFFDFETTSLNTQNCHILEFAYLLCDENMQIVDKNKYLLSPSSPNEWEPSCKDFHEKHSTASYVRLGKFARSSQSDQEYSETLNKIKNDLLSLLTRDEIKKGSVSLSGRSFINFDVPLLSKHFGISLNNPLPECEVASSKLSYRYYDTNILVFIDPTIMKKYPQPHNAEEDVWQSYILVKDLKEGIQK